MSRDLTVPHVTHRAPGSHRSPQPAHVSRVASSHGARSRSSSAAMTSAWASRSASLKGDWVGRELCGRPMRH